MDQATRLSDVWMKRALELARATGRLGNVPVGALVVKDGKMIGEAANLRHTTQDPTAHAECLRFAKRRKNSPCMETRRSTTIYVTLEPCLMCVGAIEQARVGSLVFGAEKTLTRSRRLLFNAPYVGTAERPRGIKRRSSRRMSGRTKDFFR